MDSTMHSVFQRLAINDAALAPKAFHGERMDPSAMQTWVTHFNDYARFRDIDNNTKLDLFKLLMKDQAAEWLQGLPIETTSCFDSLLKEFERRFSLTALQRERRLAEMWQRKQKPTESVDAFITAIRNMAKQVDITDEKLIRAAITTGLKPSIRMHVNQSNAKTLSDVIAAARIAEDAQTDAGMDSLARMVAVLVDQQSSKDVSSNLQYTTNGSTPAPIQSQPEQSDTLKNMFKDMVNAINTTVTDSVNQIVNERQKQQPQPQPRFSPSTRGRYNNRQWQSTRRDASPHDNGRRQQEHQRQRPSSPYPQGPGSNNYSKQNNRTHQDNRNNGPNNTTPSHSCNNCGLEHSNGQCRAFNANCYYCSKRGHFSRVCRARKQANSSH